MKYEEFAHQYVHLQADCIPVKGAIRSAIYDLTRNDMVLFPSSYFPIFQVFKEQKLGSIFEALESEEAINNTIEFIDFLQDHEMILFLEDTSCFPPIPENWEIPNLIQNAIIDLKDRHHDFKKIFHELDLLGCQIVQIRVFSNLLSLENISTILQLGLEKSIQGIELILQYDARLKDKDYLQLVEDHPILACLTIHSAAEKKVLKVSYQLEETRSNTIEKSIDFTQQVIDSHHHCGLIQLSNLSIPSVDNYFENKLYNGCLNKKISIDQNGFIKNCPSMSRSFGHIENTSLREVIAQTEFTQKWNITKDQISICRDCEFRYACTDCRAYLKQPNDLHSKPLKCRYDPYTATWKN